MHEGRIPSLKLDSLTSHDAIPYSFLKILDAVTSSLYNIRASDCKKEPSCIPPNKHSGLGVSRVSGLDVPLAHVYAIGFVLLNLKGYRVILEGSCTAIQQIVGCPSV